MDPDLMSDEISSDWRRSSHADALTDAKALMRISRSALRRCGKSIGYPAILIRRCRRDGQLARRSCGKAESVCCSDRVTGRDGTANKIAHVTLVAASAAVILLWTSSIDNIVGEASDRLLNGRICHSLSIPR